MASLYLVSTPIGNLKDITLRALSVLEKVTVVACEDTRKAGFLFQRLALKNKPRFLSYFEGNEERRIPEIMEIVESGQDVVLISNAGTPTLSDPGFKLVRECVRQEIPVVPVPGASAVLAALVASGLPTDRFLFLGFLPKKQGKRQKILESLPAKTTIVFYESPFRLLKTLKAIVDILGDMEIVIAREMTKIHEEFRRGKVSELMVFFEKRKPKGELTLLFHSSSKT